MTSEEILGFTIPPEHQCPNIDRFIKHAKSVSASIRDADRSDDIEDIKSYIGDAGYYCDDIEGYFEEVREATDSVRTWGGEWKDLAKELIEKYEPELLEDVEQ